MTNLIVPGQAQPPTYPQINAQATVQGVVFSIMLGPTITISHLVAHSDMEQIEAMRHAELKAMREQQRIAEQVMRSKL